MKLGLLTPSFSSAQGDEYIPVLDDVVRELSRRADLHIFTLHYPPRRESYDLHGARVHSIGADRAGRGRRLLMLSRAVSAVMLEHRRGPFGALHAVWVDEPGLVAVTAGRVLRIPVAVSVMGGELVAFPDVGYGGGLSRSGRAMSALALRGADCVTVSCSPAEAQVRRVLPPSRQDRVTRLVWGIDPRPFERAGPPAPLQGSFRVLHVARLGAPKDQPTLLRAMARLRAIEPGAHLHVVGDGPLRDTLAAQITGLGLTEAVTLHGHVARRDLAPYYRASDVLVISSRNEGQLVVAQEAALCGLPIVGTEVGLLADMAPQAAITAPVGDDALLAAALAKARDADTRSRLAAEAGRLVRSRWLAEHTADRLVALAERMAASRSSRG